MLTGIYILSVLVIYGIARRRPGTLWHLHPILIVALFSFVPAIALGREMFLRTELWDVVSAVPTWFSAGLSVMFVVGIIPVRKWIRKNVLDRTSEASRQFLNGLPERMMAIDAAESRGEISMEEAAARKMQVQRAADRAAAIDGVGRFLYLLLKLHILWVGLQIAGAAFVDLWLKGLPVDRHLFHQATLVAVEGIMVFIPILLLICKIINLGSEAPLTKSVPDSS
tara:strand:+ start:403 stop:1077 length:675 start_codon:yes stop_codon:yes gene_type:complete